MKWTKYIKYSVLKYWRILSISNNLAKLKCKFGTLFYTIVMLFNFYLFYIFNQI